MQQGSDLYCGEIPAFLIFPDSIAVDFGVFIGQIMVSFCIIGGKGDILRYEKDDKLFCGRASFLCGICEHRDLLCRDGRR